MSLVFINKYAHPMYTALSTDIADNKIAGANTIGGTLYLTDTDVWKIVEVGGILGDYYPAGVPLESNNAVPVNIQDQHSESVDLYLHLDTAQPTLTSPIAVDEVVFDIDSNAGIAGGDAITIHEGAFFYQALVVSSTALSVTVSTPCDKVFTVDADMYIGAWNMAVDGTVPKTFEVHPPPSLEFDIYSITISGLSETQMDGTTFLGIADGITNGLLLRVVDGQTKNLGLIVNNLGFEEFGYLTTYLGANKKSEYGMLSMKHVRDDNGVSIRLNGTTVDKFEAIIRDNLASESLMAVIIHGHVVTD